MIKLLLVFGAISAVSGIFNDVRGYSTHMPTADPSRDPSCAGSRSEVPFLGAPAEGSAGPSPSQKSDMPAVSSEQPSCENRAIAYPTAEDLSAAPTAQGEASNMTALPEVGVIPKVEH